jgi:hypothetical protein
MIIGYFPNGECPAKYKRKKSSLEWRKKKTLKKANDHELSEGEKKIVCVKLEFASVLCGEITSFDIA